MEEFNIEVTHIISPTDVKKIFDEECTLLNGTNVVKGVAVLTDAYGYYTKKGYFKLDNTGRVFVSSIDKKANWLLREQKLNRICQK